MPKLPWFKFYPSHWRADTKLSKCGLLTRGFWNEIILCMDSEGRTGKIEGTYSQLAMLARCSEDDARACVADLNANEAADVRERNGVVTLVNRRMNREHKLRQGTKKRVTKYRGKRPCNADETQEKQDGNATEDRRQKEEDRSKNNTSSKSEEESRESGRVAAGGGEVEEEASLKTELEALGLTGEGLRVCYAKPGLTPAHVALLATWAAKESKKRPDGGNPAGLVLHKIRNGYTPPEILTPKDVERLGARIVRIGEMPVNGHKPRVWMNPTTNVEGVKWQVGEGPAGVRGLPASALLASSIVLKRST